METVAKLFWWGEFLLNFCPVLKWVFLKLQSNLKIDFFLGGRGGPWGPNIGGNWKGSSCCRWVRTKIIFMIENAVWSFDQSPSLVLNPSLHYKDLKHVDLVDLMQGLEKLFRYFDFSGWACCPPSHTRTQKKYLCSIWNQSLQEYCKKEEGGRFKPVPAFTGHGIGTYFHGPPGEFLRHTDFHFQLLLAKKFSIFWRT